MQNCVFTSDQLINCKPKWLCARGLCFSLSPPLLFSFITTYNLSIKDIYLPSLWWTQLYRRGVSLSQISSSLFAVEMCVMLSHNYGKKSHELATACSPDVLESTCHNSKRNKQSSLHQHTRLSLCNMRRKEWEVKRLGTEQYVILMPWWCRH